MPKAFNSTKDIPDLEGKVILITGGMIFCRDDNLRHLLITPYHSSGNSGIGQAKVQALAAHNPKCIYLCARRTSSGDQVVSSIHAGYPNAKIEVLQLDLNSFDSIKKCAATFNSSSDRLDILFLNAGGGVSAASLSNEGYESQFGGAPTFFRESLENS